MAKAVKSTHLKQVARTYGRSAYRCWKVMEFRFQNFHGWKVVEWDLGAGKSWKTTFSVFTHPIWRCVHVKSIEANIRNKSNLLLWHMSLQHWMFTEWLFDWHNIGRVDNSVIGSCCDADYGHLCISQSIHSVLCHFSLIVCMCLFAVSLNVNLAYMARVWRNDFVGAEQ